MAEIYAKRTGIRYLSLFVLFFVALVLWVPDDSKSARASDDNWLTVALSDAPESLDPAQIGFSGLGRHAVMQVYDRLLDIRPGSSELVPSLATEIPTVENGLVSADHLTFTFPIRQGVRFHDGSELTASAVKYSWDRVMTMNLPEGQARSFLGIVETKAVDDHTFSVTLAKPDASFLYRVVASMPSSIVSPKAVEEHGGIVAGQPNEWMAQNMVGTGPYRLAQWKRGEGIDLEIFDGYWGEAPSHNVRWMQVETDVGMLGLKAGDYDIIEAVARNVETIKKIPGANVQMTLGSQLLQIAFNMNIPEGKMLYEDTIPRDFFHDVRVRKAFSHAYNYDAYIKGFLRGFGGRHGAMLPSGSFGADPNAPYYDYDLAKAEALFRETGWWDKGFTVSIVAEEDTTFEAQALVLKDGLEKLNPKFHVNVVGLPEARTDEILAMDPMPVAMWAFTTPQLTDPAEYMTQFADPDGVWGKILGFRNGYESDPDEMAAMIAAAKAEIDLGARAEAYHKLQALLHEEALWIWPSQRTAVVASSSKVSGLVPTGMWPRPGMYYALYDKSE